MGYDLFLVSTINRLEWIENKYDLAEVVYMGDGIFDSIVMNQITIVFLE